MHPAPLRQRASLQVGACEQRTHVRPFVGVSARRLVVLVSRFSVHPGRHPFGFGHDPLRGGGRLVMPRGEVDEIVLGLGEAFRHVGEQMAVFLEELLRPKGMEMREAAGRPIERADALLRFVVRQARAGDFRPLHEFADVVEQGAVDDLVVPLHDPDSMT